MDGADVMSAAGGEDARVEELLRINAELGAELRALRSSLAQTPRPGPIPAAMGISRLRGERQALESQLEAKVAELEAAHAAHQATQVALEDVQANRKGLERQNQEMAAEIVRLRTGMRGLMRRARARMLGRTGLFGAR